jgi:hypothetical protein
MFNRQGAPTVVNCIFSNNSAGNTGGGIYNHHSSPTVVNCALTGNWAGTGGGGINNGSDSSPVIVNCTFSDNSAGSYGGAIANHLSNPTVTNSILWGNAAPTGSQIALQSGSSVTISYSDLEGSAAAVYDDGTGLVISGAGNIAADPELDSDNYHLQAGSPCIDAGDPGRDYSGQNDIDGEQRVMGLYADMGCDETEAPPYFYVDDNSPSDPGPGDPELSDLLEDGSMEHPFDSIQEAIDNIGAGGTVFVLDGTYTGPGNHDIDFGGTDITLSSLNGPGNCTIDCENLGRGFDFHSGETEQSVVSGFTITNGQADYGGAIRCVNADPQILTCVITGNTAANHGGGFYLDGSMATIADCVISNNSPDGIWIESGTAGLAGAIGLVSNDLAGGGTLQLQNDANLEMQGSNIYCSLSGPGTIHSPIDSKLVIGGDAIINLSDPNDPNAKGTIICDGQLQVKEEVQISSAHMVITVASIENNAVISNNLVTVNRIAPYGQFFVEPNVVVSDNVIHADGDRYMNHDPLVSAGGLVNNVISVTVTEGVDQAHGGLLELRGKDGYVSHSCPPEQFLCQVPPGTIPDWDINTWTLERLELITGAKLNLTNRSIYQAPYDPGSEDEVLYVRELILRENSVLNTGYNRVYYETLVKEAGAITTDEPLVGFSLTNIALDDETEFIIRVTHNNFEDPADPGNNRIHVEQVFGIPFDPAGMMRMCNLLDNNTGQVVNARAKGLFATADEDEVLIKFEYLFEGSGPGAEMAELVVSLSDVPEMLEHDDPDRADHYLEVARLYVPPAGQDGSIGSESLGVFEKTVPTGGMNFIRGVRMELELVGPEGTCLLMNNWDPYVACIYCGDVTGDFAVTPRDFLTVLGECGGLSSSTNQQGQALYCLDGAFCADGFLSAADLSVSDWEEWQISEGLVGSLCLDFCLDCGAGSGSGTSAASGFQTTSTAQYQTAGLGDLEGPILISGKRFDASGQDFMSDRLYEFDESFNFIGGPFAANNDRMNGKLVRDYEGQFYQTNLEEGLVRLSDNSTVIPRGQGFAASSEPRHGQSAMVYIGFQDQGEDTWGRAVLDAAFDPEGYVYVTPVVVVPDIADTYVASAKLEIVPGETPPYLVVEIYDDPPLPNNNQDRTNLREIEVDSEGNVYVINSGYTNNSDILWVYDANGNIRKCEMQDLGIYAPIGLCCSHYDGSRLYVASALCSPDAASALIHVLSTTDLTLIQSIDVNNVGHIADITEDPVTGSVWVVGFAMAQYMTSLPGNLSQMPQFYEPYLASVPYGSVGPVQATHISNASDLALPLSIIWTGTDPSAGTCWDAAECAGQPFGDATCDGSVNLADLLALKASFGKSAPWTPPECCADSTQDGSVNLGDLLALKAGFGALGYSPSTLNQSCPP